jgi:parvulin-like peptidyl-prolyl isomerase
MILVAWFVNGEMVDDAAVREEARLMRPHYLESVGPMDPIEAEMQLREWARENVIERMLLKSAAFADPQPVPTEALENEAEYRLERLLARIQAAVPEPKPKEIAEVYKNNKTRFMSPELVHAAHIVKNVDEQQDEATARAAIEAAMAELKAGIPFAEVADKNSDCAGNGGDLGWYPRGQMVDEFDEVVFDLPVGARSEIFRSPFGFHIATVIARRPAGLRPLKEVEGEIATAIMQEKRQKALEDYIDGLRAKAEIKQGKAAQ